MMLVPAVRRGIRSQRKRRTLSDESEQQIEEAALRGSLGAVQKVADAERAAAVVREPMLSFLDLGEQSLWAHALSRPDEWVLCGPDKASLRFGVRLARHLALANDLAARVNHAFAGAVQRHVDSCTMLHGRPSLMIPLERGTTLPDPRPGLDLWQRSQAELFRRLD
jgi:hypothetical protein